MDVMSLNRGNFDCSIIGTHYFGLLGDYHYNWVDYNE